MNLKNFFRLGTEHEELTLFFENLDMNLVNADTLDGIGKLLEQHVRVEERALFQDVQQMLTDEELSRISKILFN